MLKNIEKFILPLSIILAGLFIAVAFVFVNKTQNGETGALPAEEVAKTAIKYINENILGAENAASLIDVVEDQDFYRIRFTIGDREYNSYTTKDGKLLFPEGYNLAEEIKVVETQRDIPDVKLFVMSYCPYGLQAQKMFLPVYDLFKDKANMGVYFVDYIMHEKQEIDENLTQYCVQKEEKDKYGDYLSCFTASGNSEDCRNGAGINKAKIENCIFETDRDFNITSFYRDKSTWLSGQYPQFNVQFELNEQYGIEGSPTIVINDQIVNVNPRTPERFKEIVCQAFTNLPEECSETLSNEIPSTGIGGGSGSSDSGSCH